MGCSAKRPLTPSSAAELTAHQVSGIQRFFILLGTALALLAAVLEHGDWGVGVK